VFSLDEPFGGVDWARYKLAVGPVDFDCAGCGADTFDEFHMVTDDVWQSLSLPDPGVLLCIGCLENLLGRMLTPADFTGWPINTERWNLRSSRLESRLHGDSSRY
jgi:hypothetical protein